MSLTDEPRTNAQRGVTLIELMVVVAIIGVLGGVAIFSFKSSSYGAGAVGLARRFVSEIETSRVRALSSGRWQRIDVFADRAVVSESTTGGMVTPVAWQELRLLDVPQRGRFWAAEGVTRAGGGMSPTQGAGLPFTLLFAPDGSAQPATVYFAAPAENAPDDPLRVVVYRATGVAYLWEGW